MLSDEEKKQVVEKISYEIELRRSLSLDKDRSRLSLWDWLNSNIILLLLGSMLTGILVPLFQSHQKTLEWKRQLKYDKVKFSLEMMRTCLTEFVLASTYTSEAYERIRPFLNESDISEKEYNKFSEQSFEIQTARFRQYAKIVSLVIYFVDANETLELITDYMNHSTSYIRDIEYFMRLKYCLGVPLKCTEKFKKANEADLNELKIKIEDFFELNEKLSDAIAKIQDEIAKVELENEKFRF